MREQYVVEDAGKRFFSFDWTVQLADTSRDPGTLAMWIRRDLHRDRADEPTEKARTEEASVAPERPKRSGDYEHTAPTMSATHNLASLVVGATGIEPVTSAV